MEHASVYGGCPPPVSRRMAAAVRGPLGRVMPALTAQPDPARASLRGGYQLLRCAENLELYAALQRPAPGCGPLDLAALTTSLLTAAREVCPTRPQRLQGGGGPVPLPVVCHARSLTAVILNLVSNSLLYAGPAAPIRLEAWRQGSRAVVRVRDKGCGIPDIQKAMEPLFTTGGEERAGLGFAVMQSFCDSVRVTSAVGRGTSVTLTKYFEPKE